MFEKIYTRLLLLYPSRFRKQYKDESLQLIRDRLRDETGLFNHARLWLDLVTDLLTGLPQAYRNSYAAEKATALSPNIEGVPSFKVLDAEPLRRGAILFGGSASLCAIAAFGFVMNHPPAYAPLSGSNRRLSPIEAVIARVNKVTSPDSNIGAANEPANPASAEASVQPQPTTQAMASSTAEFKTPESLPEINNGIAEQQQAISIRVQSPNAHFSYPKAVAATTASLPESPKPLEPVTRAKVFAQEPDKGCVARQLQLKGSDGAQLKPNPSKTTALEDCLPHHNSVTSHARHRTRQSSGSKK